MDKFSELKAAAMAATPGPWSWKSDQGFYYLSPEGVNTPLERIIDDGSAWGEYAETIEHDGPDARFIAAANPAVVLALLAELETERTSREQWQQNCQRTEARLHEVATACATAEQRADRMTALAHDYDVERQHQAQRIAELEAKLATPVRLPRPGFVTCSGERHYTYGADEVKVAIRAAGFTVEGDEQ